MSKQNKRRGAFTSRDEEIERLRNRLEDHESAKRLKPFIDEFLTNLGMVLAYTPFESWPPIVKAAFNAAGDRAPTARHEYIERNKKYALK